MPILYQHQPDEAITWQKIAFDEEGGWWAGVQQCAANVALAAALAVTSLSTAQAKQVFSYHQDDPGTVNLHVVPESDFWQNPAAPLPASLYQKLPYWFDANEIIPLAAVPLSPDEDFWQPFLSAPAVNYQRLPIGTEDDTPILFGRFDEDFWPTLVAPSQLSFRQLYWFEGNEFVAQQFIPGEDLWQNPSPVPAPIWKSYIFTDAEGIPRAVIPPPPTGAHYIPVFRRRRR